MVITSPRMERRALVPRLVVSDPVRVRFTSSTVPSSREKCPVILPVCSAVTVRLPTPWNSPEPNENTKLQPSNRLTPIDACRTVLDTPLVVVVDSNMSIATDVVLKAVVPPAQVSTSWTSNDPLASAPLVLITVLLARATPAVEVSTAKTRNPDLRDLFICILLVRDVAGTSKANTVAARRHRRRRRTHILFH